MLNKVTREILGEGGRRIRIERLFDLNDSRVEIDEKGPSAEVWSPVLSLPIRDFRELIEDIR